MESIRVAGTPADASKGNKFFLVAVVAVQTFHLTVLLLPQGSELYSNYIQLILPLIAVAVCLRRRISSTDAASRLRWLVVSSAFFIWSLGQVWYLLRIYHPHTHWASLRVDDALWILFGLPLLLVNYCDDDGTTDSVRLLDRAQATLFLFVLYLLIFLPPKTLSFAAAFNIQDLALVLCGLLRLTTCKSNSERRFYARLNVFLLIYGAFTFLTSAIAKLGFVFRSMEELVWTLPITFFLVSTLREELWPRLGRRSDRFARAARDFQGLGVTVLAFSSLGLSALLAHQNLGWGGTLVIVAFALFALRMNAREVAWYHDHCRLQESVLQDALTGLGNRIQLRNSLTDRLANPVEHTATVLLFIDLDHFKGLNDSLGHGLGDRLLIEVGVRLRHCSPIASVVCRVGGDEFVIVTTARDAEEAQAIGDAVLNSLRQPFLIGGHTLRCTASVGVTFADSEENADELLRTADHAMYQAKKTGKNRVQVFDALLVASMSIRWQKEADLREAIEVGALTLAYQPIIAVADGTISGVEALVRWTHSKWGDVPSSELVAIAEETGLILNLGRRILEQACFQIAEWNRLWSAALSVSVNVSPRQLIEPGLLQEVISILERTGLPSQLLRLEITESALLVNESLVKQVLSQARDHGIRVALDDFGTGYSSLSYLIALPADEIKIDRSFVSEMHRDPQRRELVSSVIQLAHTLGKHVVAEGVESEQELWHLSRMGCDYVQGWLTGVPLAATSFEQELPSIRAWLSKLNSRGPKTDLDVNSPSESGSMERILLN